MDNSPLIVAHNISSARNGKTLFRNISFTLSKGSKIGLVGTNGCGKSTLLKILSKQEELESGSIVYKRDIRVEYVPQFAPRELIHIQLLHCIKQKLTLSENLSEEWRAYEILDLMKFEERHFNVPLGQLSGGEVNRALLALALSCEPEVLLLDEPTNHMDIESILLFEKILSDYFHLSFCIVSHDRAILDAHTTETIFLRDESAYHFNLPYSRACGEFEAMDISAQQHRADEEREVVRLTKSANRLRAWTQTNSGRAASLRNMVRRVDRLKDNLTPVSREKKRIVSIGSSHLEIKKSIQIEKAKISNNIDQNLFEIINFSLSPGDKAAIVGRNGVGKTSFVRRIIEAFENDYAGPIRVNPQLILGYYDQELKRLSLEKEIFEQIRELCDDSNETIRRMLIEAGFPYERHGTCVHQLSGGEKARLMFLVLRLQKPSFLVLDEPTNHLDVQGIEQLEEELDKYTGTCIFVSHDRTFIRNIANRTFRIVDGRLEEE